MSFGSVHVHIIKNSILWSPWKQGLSHTWKAAVKDSDIRRLWLAGCSRGSSLRPHVKPSIISCRTLGRDIGEVL